MPRTGSRQPAPTIHAAQGRQAQGQWPRKVRARAGERAAASTWPTPRPGRRYPCRGTRSDRGLWAASRPDVDCLCAAIITQSTAPRGLRTTVTALSAAAAVGASAAAVVVAIAGPSGRRAAPSPVTPHAGAGRTSRVRAATTRTALRTAHPTPDAAARDRLGILGDRLNREDADHTGTDQREQKLAESCK